MTPQHLGRLIEEIDLLVASASALERDLAPELVRVAPEHRASARNLVHYLALRQHDLRELQDELAELGLSSLGRLEPHVMASVEAVRVALHRLAGRPTAAPGAAAAPLPFRAGAGLLAASAEALLGPSPEGRSVRVMVTMPSEAADSPELVRELLAAGMDVMRINCAHDDRDAWGRMVSHLRDAVHASGRPCRVLCDLAGPKLRTGAIVPGPGVLHYWPLRDDAGHILTPARVRLVAAPAPPHGEPLAIPVLPIDADLLASLRPRDELRFEDVRGRHRRLLVTDVDGGGATAEAERTAYVGSQAKLGAYRDGVHMASGCVGDLPPIEEPLRLAVGDLLVLTSDCELGRPALLDETAAVLRPAQIGCTLPAAFDDVQPGHRILFDDGKLGGVVREVRPGRLHVEITQARSGKAKLRGDRGINLPDTDVRVPAITQKDLDDLTFVVEHADLVGLSFVRSAGDVEALLAELDARGASQLGVVLKIETQRAFDELPRLLLSALRRERVGVMVARGDLGVELGFSRLAEVQEEILWLCEAAHVPVIWATQVLESLAKKGMPSRAEVTDAAMGGRAECVMLNKGPYVGAAVRFLCDVLQRMEGHQEKKRSLLRRLRVSRMR